MLIIRLQRVGRVHEPSFRIVLTDSKFGPKSGKSVEVLGSYDARKGKGTNHVDAEKVKYWISKGAKLSETVNNFLIDQKVITGKKINVLPKNKIINAKKAKEAEEAAKAPKPAPVVEAPVAEAPVTPVQS
ncbi:MAG: 30S ribosomal protein S16 [bacterium]